MGIKEKIEQYTGWFKERIRFINTISDDETKILCYCTLMDALAKCVLPDRGNKERFVNLLELFGQNDIWTRVSIYHIVSDPKFKPLRKNKDLTAYIEKKLEWLNPNVGSNPYMVDPTINVIVDDVSSINSRAKFITLCKTYKFSVYFYEKYRCGLVHEARIATKFHFDFHKDNKPYYINYIDLEDNEKNKKNLVIPVNFILEETQHITKNIYEWLIEQNVNPYERHGLE